MTSEKYRQGTEFGFQSMTKAKSEAEKEQEFLTDHIYHDIPLLLLRLTFRLLATILPTLKEITLWKVVVNLNFPPDLTQLNPNFIPDLS